MRRCATARMSGAVVAMRTIKGPRAVSMCVARLEGERASQALENERDHEKDPQPTVERMAHLAIVGGADEGNARKELVRSAYRA